tara:strand:- start:492 stop:644 length:153 start_codon:yes stop_codon:yes gene_type:complete
LDPANKPRAKTKAETAASKGSRITISDKKSQKMNFAKYIKTLFHQLIKLN